MTTELRQFLTLLTDEYVGCPKWVREKAEAIKKREAEQSKISINPHVSGSSFLPKTITRIKARAIDEVSGKPIGGATATFRKKGIPLAWAISGKDGGIIIEW